MCPWLQPDTPSLDLPGLTSGETGERADGGAQGTGRPLVTAGLRQALAQAEQVGSLEGALSSRPPTGLGPVPSSLAHPGPLSSAAQSGSGLDANFLAGALLLPIWFQQMVSLRSGISPNRKQNCFLTDLKTMKTSIKDD